MTVFDIVTWIVLGALAGWIASLIMRTNSEQGGIANIVVGIIGALIGGFVLQLVGFNTEGNFLSSLIVAILGAVILLAVVRAFTGRTTLPR